MNFNSKSYEPIFFVILHVLIEQTNIHKENFIFIYFEIYGQKLFLGHAVRQNGSRCHLKCLL